MFQVLDYPARVHRPSGRGRIHFGQSGYFPSELEGRYARKKLQKNFFFSSIVQIVFFRALTKYLFAVVVVGIVVVVVVIVVIRVVVK